MFQGHAGNIGCTFPPDLFALDLDRKNGKDGFAELESLESKHGMLPDTLTQKTPNGGEHRIFRKPADVTLRNNSPRPGIDIRATGAYIACEPSSIEGRPYAWNDWEPTSGEAPEIADAPGWLLKLIQGDTQPPPERTQPSAKARTAVIDATLQELRAALLYVDHDDYLEWIAVGNALAELGEPGRDLWLEWTTRSPRFKPEEAAEKWASFHPTATGYRAVFSKAQRAGWINPLSNAAGVRNIARTDRALFPFAHVRDLLADHAPPVWLIDAMIEAGTLGQVFGASGCGKSFLVMDWAACIATGRTWHGKDTAPGAVFYIAGEGFAGYKRRLRAWEIHTGQSLASAPLFFSRQPAALMDAGNAQMVIEAVKALQAKHGKPALIVVDTLHRNMGDGDENNAGDVALFLQSLDAMRAEFGAAVLIVHHSGHAEAGRGRGSSSLRAAVDHEYQLAMQAERRRELTCTKAKEAEPPPAMWFDIEQVELDWPDGKGGFQSSAVLVACNGSETLREKRLTAAQLAGMESFYRAAVTHGSEAGERFGVELEAWREEFYRVSTADNQHAKKTAFQRVRKDLVTIGKLTVDSDVYSCRADDLGLAAARILQSAEEKENDADSF